MHSQQRGELGKSAEPPVTKMERNLARIAACPSEKEKYDTFGVIVDASDTHRLPGKEFFTTKLKIIDSSFNVEETIENRAIKVQKHAFVFIKNLNRDDAPNICTIGTVIRLRRFKFKINERGELYAIMADYSNWLLIGQQDGEVVIEDRMERHSNATRQLAQFEAQKAQKLFQWSRGFLADRSLRSVLWWTPLIEPNSTMHAATQHLSQGGVDLMLRVERVESEARRITFADELGKKYFLIVESRPVIPVGAYVKLRSVDVRFATEGRILSTRNSSSCLLMPEWSFDVKLFNPDFYHRHFHTIVLNKPRNCGDNDNFDQRHKVLAVYPFLDDYYFEEFLIGRRSLMLSPNVTKIESKSATIIRKDFENRLPTLLSFFRELRRGALNGLLHQKFVVLVSVTSVSSARDIAVVYHCHVCRKTQRVQEKQAKQCCGRAMAPVLSLQLMLVDTSVTRPLPVYAVTRNADRHPFTLWQILPQGSRDEKAGPILQNVETLRRKAGLLMKEKEPFKLVVEIKKTLKGVVFFEVSDTYFLP